MRILSKKSTQNTIVAIIQSATCIQRTKWRKRKLSNSTGCDSWIRIGLDLLVDWPTRTLLSNKTKKPSISKEVASIKAQNAWKRTIKNDAQGQTPVVCQATQTRAEMITSRRLSRDSTRAIWFWIETLKRVTINLWDRRTKEETPAFQTKEAKVYILPSHLRLPEGRVSWATFKK